MVSQPAERLAERFDRGGLWAAILVMFGWQVIAILPVVISGWLRYGPGGSGAAVWLVYLMAGSVSAWVVLHGGGRSPALPLVICPILLAGVVIGAFAVHGGFFGRFNWPFTVSGWFAVVALWRRSLAKLITFFAANMLAGAIALIVLHEISRLGIARFIVETCSVSALPITIFVGSRAVAAIAQRAADAEDALARTRNERLAAEAVQEARKSRYETIRKTVVHLLDGLAAGRLDLAKPATRQEIAVAVTRLRRYLVETDEVPDPLSHELQACADAAERRGIAVELLPPVGVVPVLTVETRRALTEPVIQVLAATVSRARITVVASPVEVVVAVMADAHLHSPIEVIDAAVQPSQDAEGELLWVQARWDGLCASLS